jgi:zinc transport system substrate-binding protein
MLTRRRPLRARALLTVAVTTGTLAALAACGSGAGSSSGDDGTLDIVASFYPLQYVASRVVGDQGEVASLTKPGAEPHDLELTPQDVAAVSDADLVFYVKGFQASVDDAVATEGGDNVLDVAKEADLTLMVTPVKEDGSMAEARTDPHFWLDPLRLADVSDAFAAKVSEIDPDHAEEYRANAQKLRADLEDVDGQYREGLATCNSRAIVTSHTAFGYLAKRYNLTQMGIAGLSPETEPTAAQLAAAADFVRENDVTTIYYETLISPKIAETVASETGASVSVLDPIEGLTEDSAGDNYLQVAESNLASLRAGQQCG